MAPITGWFDPSPKGGALRLAANSYLPAKGDPAVGGEYVYTDTQVLAGRSYFYQLEEVERNGRTEIVQTKAGQTMFNEPGTHLPENVGDAPFELILVELKGKAAKKK